MRIGNFTLTYSGLPCVFPMHEQSKCHFSISVMLVGKLLQFLDVFLDICEHAPDKNNQCHRIFEVLNSTGKLGYISCKKLLQMLSD